MAAGQHGEHALRLMAEYLKLGYVPEEDGPASSTFEYAYDDRCAAVLAGALGKQQDETMFALRSGNWRNGLSPVTGFAQRRRADGAWIEPNDLDHFGTTGGWSGPGFLEGTAWIYSWFVPQDVPALVATIGRDRFNERLEQGFASGRVDLTNEPNLEAAARMSISNRPYSTESRCALLRQNMQPWRMGANWCWKWDRGRRESKVNGPAIGGRGQW